MQTRASNCNVNTFRNLDQEDEKLEHITDPANLNITCNIL